MPIRILRVKVPVQLIEDAWSMAVHVEGNARDGINRTLQQGWETAAESHLKHLFRAHRTANALYPLWSKHKSLPWSFKS